MNAGQEPDEWLMLQVANGRHEQMTPLVRRHATLLLSFIRQMVGDRHRAEELFQDVLLSVWKNRRQYAYPRLFKPWLYRIAINRCHQAFRMRGLGRILSLDEAAEPVIPPVAHNVSPHEAAVATENGVIVSRAVADLPPRQRMVVLMHLWEGMSYAQIAEAMRIREVTVRSNMHDALASVRRAVQPLM